MADDKIKTGGSDRAQVAASEGYEVDYFASEHGITPAAARKLIERVGNDREKLDAAVAAKSTTKREASQDPKSASRGGGSRATASKRPKAAAQTAKPRPRSAARSSKAAAPITAALDAVGSSVVVAAETAAEATQRGVSAASKAATTISDKSAKGLTAAIRSSEPRPSRGVFAGIGVAILGFVTASVWRRNARFSSLENDEALNSRLPITAEDAVDTATSPAHRADGTDDSASFGALIADEGTIPGADPGNSHVIR